MKTPSLRRLGLTALLAGGTALAAQAQFTYSPTSTSTNAGTYTDLGTTGTAIATANNDDANSAAQAIGFTFNFNGTAFNQFVLNTNGLLRLGANAPAMALAASPYAQNPEIGPINSTDPADVNLLLPFNFDLGPGTSAPEYRVATTGTAGSRVCTIQWKNVADKAVATDAGTPATIPSQYTNLSFQVKLYEGTNQVEFVYNAPTVGTTTALKYAVVGVKGSSSAASVIASKPSSAAWSATTFVNGPQQDASLANAHNFRATFAPDAGRTYRFFPLQPNDAAVATLYTLGKLSRSLSAGHQVTAVVANRGTSALVNLVVTLNVTGANTINSTQTIAALAPNATTTVTFAAYPATLALGTNNVAVSVPNDDNSGNNTATYTQQVTTDQVLIADPAVGGVGALSYSSTTAGGSLAAKFTVGGTNNKLANAVFYFSPISTAATDYQAVLYSANGAGTAPGAVLFTSATQNRPKAGGPITISMNNTTVPNTYFVGIKEIGLTGAGLSTQPETPLRTGTFVFSADGLTWNDLSTTALQVRLLIESNLSVVLASSPALLRAVTIYPNPSASGIFTLDVKGANASAAGLGIEVTNQLGQRVYAGSARDNFVNQLNLSNLAPGIYHLTVRNGGDYSNAKLSIGL